MNNERMKEALDSIVRRDVRDDANLWPRIVSRLNEGNSLTHVLHARPALIALIILLLLSLLGGVVYAIGRSLGYVPGVGLVEEGRGIRVLAEPFTAKRDGLTVTVEQVVADARHTIIRYEIEGIPIGSFMFMCPQAPFLQLPGGGKLVFLSGGEGGMDSSSGEPMKFKTSYLFPSLPERTETVSLVFPCILSEHGDHQEEWSIPLALVPAPVGYMTPVVEIEVTAMSSGPQFNIPLTMTAEGSIPGEFDTDFPPTSTPVPNGSGLYLDRVIEMDDAYILVGNFTDAGDLPGILEPSTSSIYFYRPYIGDENGKLVRFQPRIDIKPDVISSRVNYWAYEIPKPVQGPITIRLDKIAIVTSSTVRFEVDTGLNPQPGQTWQLELPIQLGRYVYVMDSVEMLEDGYIFRFHSGIDVPEGTSFILDIPGSSRERGSTEGVEDRRPKDIVKYSQTITYLVSPPTGHLTVELALFENMQLPGPWTLTWTPPGQNP